MNILLLSALLGSFFDKADIQTPPPPPPEERRIEVEILRAYRGEVTAYTSRKEETDDTPFVSASGEPVRWGIVATNAYPFGTRLRFPELYGDKVFTVKDRMNARYKNRIDIWFPEHETARVFGVKKTKVELIAMPFENDLSLK